jgi:4-hydroxybenzoate polyprenyltransferase
MPSVDKTSFSHRLNRLVAYIELTRPYNALVFATTFSIGYFWTSSKAIGLDYWAGIIILVLLHSLATIQNDLEDIVIDRANKRSGALINHTITPAQARKGMFILWAAAIFMALIAPQATTHLLVVSVLLLLAWTYNRPPLLLSRKPISSVIVMALSYGLAPLAYGFIVSSHRVPSYMVLLFIFWFILRVSTVILKDYKDAHGDKAHNKRTFYLRYGADATARVSVIAATIGYAGVLALLWRIGQRNTSSYFMLVVATLLGIRNVFFRLKLLAAKDNKERHSIFKRSLSRQTQFELGVIICLLVF